MPHLLIIGASDAGISAALRAREVNPACEVTVVVADRYPNYSLCGPPIWGWGDVGSGEPERQSATPTTALIAR
jgi:NADPH-dependent 2,4-dienoyl-CoA reductase/sulfur reductase-like enzyme